MAEIYYVKQATINGRNEETNVYSYSFWSIVNNRMLTWAIPHTSRNGTKYICLTQGLRKAIGNYLNYCDDLKSIGELLGWNYQSVRFGNNDKVMKVLKVSFDDFMDFLYPNVDLEGKL